MVVVRPYNLLRSYMLISRRSDGENALSYTIWAYEPYNTHIHGDGWNGEDLSFFSYDDTDGDDDLVADNPPDLRSLITLGARGIDGWCRPYPLEIQGRIQTFSFHMSSTRFSLRIEVISLEGSRMWQNQREASGQGEAPEAAEASTLVYLPFVHYLARPGVLPGKQTNMDRRLVGKPSDNGEEWVKGEGPAVVDLEIESLSEGRLEVEGQWMRWFYPLRRRGERVIFLKLRKWTE